MAETPTLPPPLNPEVFMAFRYMVTVGSKYGTRVAGGFSDVSGLVAEMDVETFRVGGLNTRDVSLAGPTKFSSRLVLKRGIAERATLWDWYSKVMSGTITREDVTIRLPSADWSKASTWVFHEACPVKWTGPELHAGTNAVAFESIELVHRGLLPL